MAMTYTYRYNLNLHLMADLSYEDSLKNPLRTPSASGRTTASVRLMSGSLNPVSAYCVELAVLHSRRKGPNSAQQCGTELRRNAGKVP